MKKVLSGLSPCPFLGSELVNCALRLLSFDHGSWQWMDDPLEPSVKDYEERLHPAALFFPVL